VRARSSASNIGGWREVYRGVALATSNRRCPGVETLVTRGSICTFCDAIGLMAGRIHVRERVSWSVHGMARSQAGEMLTTTMVGVAARATQGSRRERIVIQARERGDVLFVCVVFGSWRCKADELLNGGVRLAKDADMLQYRLIAAPAL